MTIEQAIEWQKAFRRTYNGVPAEVDEAVDMAITALQEQKNHGWIPCEDRLPDEGGSYIVTINANERYNTVDIDTFYSGGTWCVDKLYDDSKVTAWMQLPEPYKEADNED